MKRNLTRIALGLAALALTIALPLLGAVITGEPVTRYTEFPPLTHYVEHVGFSWPVFVALGLMEIPMFLFLWIHLRRRRAGAATDRQAFPWWGWAGLSFGVAAWVLAWTRFRWFAPLQPFTFSPLWFAYIVVINALTYRRTGHCMMRDRPAVFGALFPVSALFWWLFEYLNRFVQNWYYVGVDGLGPLQYFLYATLPFATVLPAVLGTCEWLGSYFDSPLTSAEPHRRRRGPAMVALLVTTVSLSGIGIWPDILFPMLWIAPLLAMAALLELRGDDSLIFSWGPAGRHRMALLALAALQCGFFWELWNYHSLAKWIYAVPFVNRFHLFEMPILGYAGYLPFGLECGLVASVVASAVGSLQKKK